MPLIDNRFPKCYICGMNKYGLQDYSFEIGPIDDSGETVAIVGIEYSSVSSLEKFYRKDDVDALLAKKDAEIRRLKRALYKSLANWAHEAKFDYDDEFSLWDNMEDKCLAKADEFSELTMSPKQQKQLQEAEKEK